MMTEGPSDITRDPGTATFNMELLLLTCFLQVPEHLLQQREVQRQKKQGNAGSLVPLGE